MKKMLVTFAVVMAVTSFVSAYFTGFEDGPVKSTYAIGTVTHSNIVWTFDSALHATLGTLPDRIEGTRSVRLARNNGVSEASIYTQVITGSFSAISFKYARYGTDPAITHRCEYSTDNGSTWVQIGSDFISTSTDLTLFHETFGPVQDINIRIRTLSGGTGSRVRSNIDTLALIPEPGAIAVLCGAGALAVLLTRRLR